MSVKPLNGKCYGSIGHLPNSKLGQGDRHIDISSAKMLTVEPKNKKDLVIVQQKVDGSCCSVACDQNGSILALTRSGYLATTSPYSMHHMFSRWVSEREDIFKQHLKPGYRIVGEWLAQAHGTRYKLPHGPFVMFDLIDSANTKSIHSVVENMASKLELPMPQLVHKGKPISTSDALNLVDSNFHGALDPIEGIVYRLERQDRVLILAKYVQQSYIPGKYLSGITGSEDIWNWTF